MNRLFPLSQRIYLSVSALMQIAGWILLFTFYLRKIGATERFFVVSVIEDIPRSTYHIWLTLGVLIVAFTCFALWSAWKKKSYAKWLFGALFAGQLLGVVLVWGLLRRIEGVYFWKSAYVEKFLYGAAVILILSLIPILAWGIDFLRKQNQKSPLPKTVG